MSSWCAQSYHEAEPESLFDPVQDQGSTRLSFSFQAGCGIIFFAPTTTDKMLEYHCKHFSSGNCRSCSRLAIGAGEEQLLKYSRFEERVREQLGESPTLLPLFCPATIFPSRSKAKMSVTGTVEHPRIGILDSELEGRELLDCPLHLPIINAALENIKSLITEFKLTPYDIETKRGELKSLIIKSSADGNALLVRFVLRSTEALPRVKKAGVKLMEAIPEVISVSANIQPIAHAILEGESEILLLGGGVLWEQHGDLVLAFMPQSFSQVTSETATALYDYVSGLIVESRPEVVLDLYCGVGGFSLKAAKHSTHVTGVEISAQAIECANLGAKRNGIDNVTFIAKPVEDFLAATALEPSMVIVNPPRRGLGKSIVRTICELRPATIIYSSCNLETLLRDLSDMPDYETLSVAPFEMFPLTEHLEVVAHLQRRD